MEEEWPNQSREYDYENNKPRGRRRDTHRHDRDGGNDSAINLRVTVVADNGNLCMFHKIMADGGSKPCGIPANRISTINISQTDGSTLIITSEGTVAVTETFDEAAKIYAAARCA